MVEMLNKARKGQNKTLFKVNAQLTSAAEQFALSMAERDQPLKRFDKVGLSISQPFTEIGIGVAISASGKIYYCQDFGKP